MNNTNYWHRIVVPVAAFIIALGSAYNGFAQQKEDNNSLNSDLPLVTTHRVSFSLVEMIMPGIEYSFELPISNEMTCGAAARANTSLVKFADRTNSSFIQAEAFTRWYIARDYRAQRGRAIYKNSGFFAEANLSYAFFFSVYHVQQGDMVKGRPYKGEPKSEVNTGHMIAPTLFVGYQFTSRSHLFFNAKAGMAEVFAFNKSNDGYNYNAVPLPVLTFNIGYCF